jgi:predicted nuclease of predicted toxin-antitoxin system
MPRLLVNENFPAPATRLLCDRGVDVVSVQEIMAGGSDEAVLRIAVDQGRWLVTYDRDYGELVYSRDCAAPPAILYLRQEPYPPARAAELLLTLPAEPASTEGHFVVIAESTVRRSALPQTGSRRRPIP